MMKSPRRSRKPPRAVAEPRMRAKVPSAPSRRRFRSQKMSGQWLVLEDGRAAKPTARRPEINAASVMWFGLIPGGMRWQRGVPIWSFRWRRWLSYMLWAVVGQQELCFKIVDVLKDGT